MSFVPGAAARLTRRFPGSLLALLLLATVTLSSLGLGLLAFRADPHQATNGPDAIVFMCAQGSDAPACTGTATTAQTDDVRHVLAGLTSVKSVQSVSAADELQRFQAAQTAADQQVAVSVGQVCAALEVMLKQPSEFSQVRGAVEGMPGVQRVTAAPAGTNATADHLRLLGWASVGVAAIGALVWWLTTTMAIARFALASRKRLAIAREAGARPSVLRGPFVAATAVTAVLGGLIVTAGSFALVHLVLPQVRWYGGSVLTALKALGDGDLLFVLPFLWLTVVLVGVLAGVLATRRHVRA